MKNILNALFQKHIPNTDAPAEPCSETPISETHDFNRHYATDFESDTYADTDEPTDDDEAAYNRYLETAYDDFEFTPKFGRQASSDIPVQKPRWIIAEDDEIALLKALNKFSWLTSRQIADWAFPQRHAGLHTVRRILVRLKAKNEVLSRLLQNGIPAYFLNARGAGRLRAQDVRARSGKDVRMARWTHRALCNHHAITLRNANGTKVFSEYELYTDRSPVGVSWGKLADVIEIMPDGTFIWVEIENSRRRPSDMRKLLYLLTHGPRYPEYALNLRLAAIEIVTTDPTLASRIQRALVREIERLKLSIDDEHRILESVLISIISVSDGLILKGYPVWRKQIRDFV